MANLHTTTKLHAGTSSANLTSYLAGISFPAEKEALVSTAEHNGAGDDILEKLDNLPAGDFKSMAEVMKAYGTEIDQQGGQQPDTYQSTPAEAYGENLADRPLNLSSQQDRTWSGNPSSKEKLERNHTGASPDTVRTSSPDVSGAASQGQGYELAGGKGRKDSTHSDETDGETSENIARRPF